MSQWSGAIAHREAFELIVVTRARAIAEGFEMAEGAAFVGLVSPTDGLAGFRLNFKSFANVANFIHEMRPCALAALVDEGDDGRALCNELLAFPEGAATH